MLRSRSLSQFVGEIVENHKNLLSELRLLSGTTCSTNAVFLAQKTIDLRASRLLIAVKTQLAQLDFTSRCTEREKRGKNSCNMEVLRHFVFDILTLH